MASTNSVHLESASTEIQKEVIERIIRNDMNGIRDILSQSSLKTDVFDEHGMTPLLHAAYKGNKEMVQFLLDKGANVNSRNHEYGYTALHFAALSGNTEVCQLLLELGAKAYATNTVGRTPSQMAAFVGNHACVTVINNFVPVSDIEYYTVPSGFETEPKIPPLVSAPLHKFIMQVNLNPVRIAINFIKSPILYENIEKVKNVLKLMSEKEMKRGLEFNEILSFKYHYLSSIVAEIIRCKKYLEEKSNKASNENQNKKPTDALELFIKKMLKINKGTVPEYQENLLKEIVREFPNIECTIFRQMVSSLSKPDSLCALSVITSIINGQRGFTDSDVLVCATCGEEDAKKKCSQCKAVKYCGRDCQKFHWFMHKKFCTKVAGANCPAVNENLQAGAINAATESLISELNRLQT